MAIANYLYLSAILFTIGAIGVVVRRNSIVVFMCIELMLRLSSAKMRVFATRLFKIGRTMSTT